MRPSKTAGTNWEWHITVADHRHGDHDWRSGRDRIVSKHAIAEPARIQRALRGGAWFLCGVVRRVGRGASQRRVHIVVPVDRIAVTPEVIV